VTCPRCLYSDCLCGEIPRLETRTRVVIVRHIREAHRSSNTGRLAHLALVNSVLVDHGAQGVPTVLPDLTGAWVVYPSGPPLVVPPDPPPRQLVILDATWSQARRMFHRLDALRGLPTLPLATIGGPARLRAAPSPEYVSTIEAVASALRFVEGDAPASALEHLFQCAIERASASGRRVARSPTLDGS